MADENDPIVTCTQARRMYLGGIDRGTMWRWIKRGDLPPTIRLSQRVQGWRRSTLESLLASRKAQA